MDDFDLMAQEVLNVPSPGPIVNPTAPPTVTPETPPIMAPAAPQGPAVSREEDPFLEMAHATLQTPVSAPPAAIGGNGNFSAQAPAPVEIPGAASWQPDQMFADENRRHAAQVKRLETPSVEDQRVQKQYDRLFKEKPLDIPKGPDGLPYDSKIERFPDADAIAKRFTGKAPASGDDSVSTKVFNWLMDKAPEPARAAAEGMGQAGAGLISKGYRAADVLTDDGGETADIINKQMGVAMEGAGKADEKSTVKRWILNGIRGGTRSISEAMVGGPYGPTGMAMLAGFGEYNDALSEAKEKGFTGSDRMGYAVRAAAIETGITMLAGKIVGHGFEVTTANLFKQSAKETVKQAFSSMGKDFLKELPEEMLISYFAQVNKKISDIDPNALNTDVVLQVLADTVVQTAFVGGATHGVKNLQSWAEKNPEKAAELKAAGDTSRTAFEKAGAPKASIDDRKTFVGDVETAEGVPDITAGDEPEIVPTDNVDGPKYTPDGIPTDGSPPGQEERRAPDRPKRTLLDAFEADQQGLLQRRVKGERDVSIANLHPVSGFIEGAAANHRIAQIAVEEYDPAVPIVHAAGDFHNLGGLNTYRGGSTAANKYFGEMSKIQAKYVPKGDVLMTHYGGDEYGFTFRGLSKQEVVKAIAAARPELDAYIKENNLSPDKLPHGKDSDPKNPKYLGGADINFYVEQFDPAIHKAGKVTNKEGTTIDVDAAGAWINAAQNALEIVKKEKKAKGLKNVQRKQTEEVGDRPESERAGDPGGAQEEAREPAPGRRSGRAEPEGADDPAGSLGERGEDGAAVRKDGQVSKARAEGKVTKLNDTTGKKPIAAKYAVMEAADVIPSHDFSSMTPTKRDDYPQNLQPRDYSPNSEDAAKVFRFAKEKVAANYINNAGTADQGPSTVLPDGTVIAGNGRAMSLQVAAKEDYSWYKNKLVEDAGIYGLDAEAIKGMKHPMLVRVVDADKDSDVAKHIVNASNVTNTFSQSTAREAAQMSSLIPDEILDELRADPDGTFSTLVNDPAKGKSIRAAIAKALPASQRARYFEENGALSAAGKDFVEEMLISKAISADALAGLAPAMKKKLEAVVPQMVMMKRGDGINVVKHVEEAMKFYKGPLENGAVSYGDYTEQQDFINEKETLSKEGKRMLDFLKASDVKAVRGAFAELLKDEGMFDDGSESPAQKTERILTAAPKKGTKAAKEAKKGKKKEPVEGDTLAVHGAPGLTVQGSLIRNEDGDISSHAIIKSMERLFGIQVRLGKLHGKALGTYAPFAEIIRMKGKYAGDLAVATHEVAHHIDFSNYIVKNMPQYLQQELGTLDYLPNRGDPTEGFAEYMRKYLTEEDVGKRVPNFHKWFTETFLPANPKIDAKLKETRGYIDKWRNVGAEGRNKPNVKDSDDTPHEALNVPLLERIKNFAVRSAQRFYTAWKDKGFHLAKADAAAMANGFKGRAGDMAYELYNFFNQTGPARGNSAVENGVQLLTGNMERIGKSLGEYTKGISKEEYDDWILWSWARHSIEAWSKDVNPGMTLEDAEATYEKGKKNAHWVKAADGLTQFNNDLLDMLVDAGVYTKPQGEAMKDYWKTYLPLHRITDDVKKDAGGGTKIVDLGNAIKRRNGSGLPIVDPMQATVDRATHFYQQAAKHVVMQAFIKTHTKTKGLGKYATLVPPGVEKVNFTVEKVQEQLEAMGIDPKEFQKLNPLDVLTIWKDNLATGNGKPIVRVTIDGEQRLYELDREIYRAVSGMDEFSIPGLVGKIIRAQSSLQKLGLTGVNMGFMAANTMKDYVTYLVNEKNAKGLRKFSDPWAMIALNLQSELNKLAGGKGKTFVELAKASGLQLTTPTGFLSTRARSKNIVEGVVNAGSKSYKATQIARHPIQAMQQIISLTELAPRLAAVKQKFESLGYSQKSIENGTAKPTRADIVEAINAGSDVTVNFRRMGHLGQVANQVFIYFNASLEGTDKFVRNIKHDPKKAFIRSAIYIVAPTVYYWLKHRDDDWYKEQEEWMRNYFWITDKDIGTNKGGPPRPVLRIPKPESLSIISMATETILSQLYDKEPQSVVGAITHSMKSLVPNLKPVGTPIFEAIANRDTFKGKPIVDRSMERYNPGFQSKPENSELIKAVAEYLSTSENEILKALEFSPAKAEHVIEGMTGGLFGDIVKRGEGIVSELGGGKKKLAPSDLPGAGRFLPRQDYAASVGEFYDAKDAADKKFNRAKDLADEANKGKAPKEQTLVDTKIDREHKKMQRIGDMMTDIRLLVKDEIDRDTRFDKTKWIAGLARAAMGKKDQELHPNMFTAADVPKEVAEIRDKYILKMGKLLAAAKPAKPSKRPEYNESIAGTLEELQSLGIDPVMVRSVYKKWANKNIKTDSVRQYAKARLANRAKWEVEDDENEDDEDQDEE